MKLPFNPSIRPVIQLDEHFIHPVIPLSIYEAFWAGEVKQPLNPPKPSSIPSSIQTEPKKKI
jgi:hypothetical protein